MADVFVSYSRRDSEFVRRLVESVAERGKQAWLDTEGIADGEVFPEAIKRAIEGSDAFLFVITPAAVKSAYCEQEVEYAREMQKRIVPVLRNKVPDAELPPEIRDRNWIPFTDDADYDASLNRLVSALDTDLEAAKAHTRWLVKALEWDGESREKSFLLRGSELNAAESWLAASPEDADPAPTALQREYLLASRDGAARRQRVLAGVSVGVALVSIGLLIFALISRGQAVSERISARAQALAAESQAQLPNDPEISLILGMRAVRQQSTPQSLFALRAALDASPLERALPTVASPGACGANSGLAAAFSPDGRQIAEGACNGSVWLLDAATGRRVRSERVAGQVTSIAYSPDGSTLAAGTNAGVVLIDPRTGAVVMHLVAGAETGYLAFSPNGRIVAADNPSGVTLWRLPGGRAQTLARDPGEGGSLVFAEHGRLLLVGGYDGSVHIFDVAGGRLLRRIVTPNDLGIVGTWGEVVALSPDGSELAVGYPTVNSSQGTVSLYSTHGWRREFDVVTIPGDQIASVAFSPDGTRLAVGAEDGTSGVWSIATREQLAAFDGPTAAVTSMAFIHGGQSVLTASNDGVARIWRALGVEQTFVEIRQNIVAVALAGHTLEVLDRSRSGAYVSSYLLPGGRLVRNLQVAPANSMGYYTLSPDGRWLITTPFFQSPTTRVPVSLWNVAQGKVVRRFVLTSPNVQFSKDGTRMAVVQGAGLGAAGTLSVITLATGHSTTLRSRIPCLGGDVFAFSDDDGTVAEGNFCGYADVWNARTGRLLRQVYQVGEVSGVDLNRDGSRLLVSSWDSRATIWSVATGRPLIQLVGDTRGLIDALFSSDASLVVTESLDHTVRIWNARTGQQLRILTFPDFQGPFALSGDGGELAVADNTPVLGADDIVRVFDTCPDCQSPRGLLALAEPHAVPSREQTALERTVVARS